MSSGGPSENARSRRSMYESSRSSTGITASSATPSRVAACSPMTRSKTGQPSAVPRSAANSPAPAPYSREMVTSWIIAKACRRGGGLGKDAASVREHAPARRHADEIDGRVRVELAQDAAAVRLHRSRTDGELPRDLRGRHSLDAELEDLPLARGQRRGGKARAVFPAALEAAVVGDDEAGDLGREIGLAA